MKKRFCSEKSEDVIEIERYNRSHNISFDIIKFDVVSENIKLLNDIIDYIKMCDIKWVIVNLSSKFIIPENTVWFKNKKTKLIHCHVEDFEKFYLKNIINFINSNNLVLNLDNKNDNCQDNCEDNWIVVIDKKKEKKDKMKKINKEINIILQSMIGDWNNL